MRLRILNFGFGILVWLGLGSAYEAVFSQIFTNAIKTTTIEQLYLRHGLTSKLLETSFNIVNDIELDDLENIINEFGQGLPSDTEFNTF